MKTVEIDTLASLLPSLVPSPPAVPRVVASGNFATPLGLLKAVDAALPEFRLHLLNAQAGIPDRPGVVPETAFVGPAMRRSERLSYVPCRLSMLPLLFGGPLPPDLVVLHTSMPHNGSVSLGLEVNVLPAAIEAARARGGCVIAQINPNMPYTYGDAELPLEVIDYAVEIDSILPSPTPRLPDAASAVIGERVAARVRDGATMQLGIGAVPDATLPELSQRRRLRVWTEMFSDGILLLDAAGALDGNTPIVASFVFGSPELYAWVDRNPRVRLMRTETTNNPSLIAKQPQLTSINSALQVDLFAQANASRIGARIYSGFGGQTDFLIGALHSPGGQAFIALRSWHPKANVSTVVGLLGEPATSFQATAIVTEYGVAPIWGRDQREQAHALIEYVAHPDARAELRDAAAHLGLR
ncbi:MAG: acetyl-CoA hydrolase/transferase C-terminal domain-containing protein [Actinomycetota bacterium]